jgi:hypothetical protein
MLRNVRSLFVLMCAALSVSTTTGLSPVGSPATDAVQPVRVTEFIVSNTNDSGPGSFRAAVHSANASPGFDVIGFSIGTGVQRIEIGTAGPITITDPVEIDGTSQPGAGPSPRIEFSKGYPGAGAGGGIQLDTDGCRIHGLRFVNFVSDAAHIYAIDVPGNNNRIYGNVFGSVSGEGEPNDTAVKITGINNIVGGDLAAEGNLIRKNYRGLELVAEGPNFITGNTITENDLIAENDLGEEELPIGISTADDAGASNQGLQIKNNVVSGGGRIGFGISLKGVDGAIVENNKIGVDSTGMVPMRQLLGIQISGGLNTRIRSNIISGNVGDNGTGGGGIISYSTGVVIENNLIGLAADGVTPVPNAGGILLGLNGGRVGGDTESPDPVGNHISGNLHVQIKLDIGPGGLGRIEGNMIGLNRAGGGNGNGKTGTGTGIGGTTSSGTVKIGGPSPTVRNVISGNSGDGIRLGVVDEPGSGVSNIEIANNYIGTGAAGEDSEVGNIGSGIFIGGLASTIDIRNNRIAYNGAQGVHIPNGLNANPPGVSIEITQNEIFENGRLAANRSPAGESGLNVDLGPLGETLNDLGDPDTGGNGQQNYPDLETASVAGSSISINGLFNSLASTRYRLEFFYTTACSGNVPTSTSRYLGSTFVTTGAAASSTPFSIQFPQPAGFPINAQIQAVAINDPGSGSQLEAKNTSEYSPCLSTRPGSSVSGRVTTPNGLSLRNAVVGMTDARGRRRTATTSSFGIYQFENVPVAMMYIIGVSSKRYRFAPQTLPVNGNMASVDFVGLE